MAEYVFSSGTPRFTMGVYPAINILNMMSHLVDLDEFPGVAEALGRIADKLSPQQKERHRLIFLGLGSEALAAPVQIHAQTTFPQYIAALESLNAVVLRDSLLYALSHSAHLRVYSDAPLLPTIPEDLLEDEASYVAFMERGTKQKNKSAPHQAMYTFMLQPDRLQQTLCEHFRLLWREALLVEWERSQPLLEDVVQAFGQVDLPTHTTPIDVLEFVSGRNLRDVLDANALMQFQKILLIPSRHTGPYVSWFGDDHQLYFIFGARKPNTAEMGVRVLDKPEMLYRLQALTDEVRLDILLTIHRHGELSTQQIMDIFDLNKSTASRHLRLLRASELIHERRDTDNKGKFYSLNPSCIHALIATLTALFVPTAD
jgi:DNA-binding transcriptional ArsR family regulator